MHTREVRRAVEELFAAQYDALRSGQPDEVDEFLEAYYAPHSTVIGSSGRALGLEEVRAQILDGDVVILHALCKTRSSATANRLSPRAQLRRSARVGWRGTRSGTRWQSTLWCSRTRLARGSEPAATGSSCTRTAPADPAPTSGRQPSPTAQWRPLRETRSA